MENTYLTIVLAPLIGAIIVGLAGHRLGRTLSHSITILGVTVSTVLALYVFNHHVLRELKYLMKTSTPGCRLVDLI